MSMEHLMINDFNLSKGQIELKYEYPGYHPVIRQADWRRAVRDSQTLSGYWDYVHHKVGEYQDELDNDNPLNSWMKDIEI